MSEVKPDEKIGEKEESEFNQYCSYDETKALMVDDIRSSLCGAVSTMSNSSDSSNE
jgi:hypothetical protein